MSSFPLQIITPDGPHFDGQAEYLSVRTTTGEMGIFPGHTDLVAPLGMGRACVMTEGNRRYAACIGGMVSVLAGKVTLLATTFEWAEDIDTARAERSYQAAEAVIKSQQASRMDSAMAEARKKRALIRKSVASGK